MFRRLASAACVTLACVTPVWSENGDAVPAPQASVPDGPLRLGDFLEQSPTGQVGGNPGALLRVGGTLTFGIRGTRSGHADAAKTRAPTIFGRPDATDLDGAASARQQVDPLAPHAQPGPVQIGGAARISGGPDAPARTGGTLLWGTVTLDIRF